MRNRVCGRGDIWLFLAFPLLT